MRRNRGDERRPLLRASTPALAVAAAGAVVVAVMSLAEGPVVVRWRPLVQYLLVPAAAALLVGWRHGVRCSVLVASAIGFVGLLVAWLRGTATHDLLPWSFHVYRAAWFLGFGLVSGAMVGLLAGATARLMRRTVERLGARAD